MVKLFFVIFLLSFTLFGDETPKIDPLTKKIQTLLDTKTYQQNSAYIDIIFSPKSDYYKEQRVDVVKVIQMLKENGLLNLFFKAPKELTLHFKTSGSPLFFMKIMEDTLRNIGYYRYVTKNANLNSSEFSWTIVLTSEYATDPLILQKELAKRGCNIVYITRDSATNWTYTIDMRGGKLDVTTLQKDEEIKLKRSLYAKWINVSKINKLRITSSRRNSWYPYIAYYDSTMHLLKVIKIDSKKKRMVLNFSDTAHYIKISDIYTLKNIRDDLILYPIGSR